MDGHVSEKTDTFAFGVVLCELLTGKPPYDHATATRLSSFADDQLCEPATQLAPLLDARVPFASWAAAAGDGGGAMMAGAALELCLVANRCLEFKARMRCSMREAAPRVYAIAAAGR